MATYELSKPISGEADAALAAYHPVVRQLLFTRGITTVPAADTFLTVSYDGRHDPFLMTDMGHAVERVLKAIGAGEHIAIWSDYDCDGIPGAVLFHDFFTAIGYTNFENYIPHRHDEGFGLNTPGIDALASRGTTLMITLDCGITNVDEVHHANEKGIDTIVTDHHEPSTTLPPAYAVLDPKRDDAYPDKNLCGTGVAWKLIEALIARGNFALAPGAEKWWLDMVGLATLADMVPLVGENRILAHFGLTVMQKTKRKGLRELFRAQRLDPRNVSEDDIGFTIAPRVNAASRMGKPHDAFAVFTATSDLEAATGAAHLERINNERKGVVAAMVKDARKRLALREVLPVIVLGDPEWKPSLLGLVANTLAEEFHVPVFMWGRDGRGVLKGSCRAGGSGSVVRLMEHAKDSFLEFGGHHAAGGFAVREEKVHELGDALVRAHVACITDFHDTSEKCIDADLDIAEVTDALYRELSKLSPFGVGNDKPLFRFRAVTPREVNVFGKSKEHTKIIFETNRSTLPAIAFFKTPDAFSVKLEAGKTVDLIAHIEKSYFMNRPELRLRIVDVS